MINGYVNLPSKLRDVFANLTNNDVGESITLLDENLVKELFSVFSQGKPIVLRMKMSLDSTTDIHSIGVINSARIVKSETIDSVESFYVLRLSSTEELHINITAIHNKELSTAGVIISIEDGSL